MIRERTYNERDRQNERRADRRVDRRTDRRANRQTDGGTDRQTDGQTDRHGLKIGKTYKRKVTDKRKQRDQRDTE